MAFRRFRDTTPMAHLRALRLDMVRSELARAGQDGGSVTSVANAYGFGCPSSDDLRHIGGLQKGGSGSSVIEIMGHAGGAASDGLRLSGA
jgi:Helix-turn-helix domain